jgi:hypothetical protein
MYMWGCFFARSTRTNPPIAQKARWTERADFAGQTPNLCFQTDFPASEKFFDWHSLRSRGGVAVRTRTTAADDESCPDIRSAVGSHGQYRPQAFCGR